MNHVVVVYAFHWSRSYPIGLDHGSIILQCKIVNSTCSYADIEPLIKAPLNI